MSASSRLTVDPIACDGHGLCADLFPERIRLDDWGFPIIEGGEIGPGLEVHARRAVAACPVLALKLARRRAPRLVVAAAAEVEAVDLQGRHA
jgi:ferredoxin